MSEVIINNNNNNNLLLIGSKLTSEYDQMLIVRVRQVHNLEDSISGEMRNLNRGFQRFFSMLFALSQRDLEVRSPN